MIAATPPLPSISAMSRSASSSLQLITPGTGEIRVDDLRADTAAGAATATALVHEWGKAVGAQVGLDIPDLAKLPDMPVSGAATVRTDL